MNENIIHGKEWRTSNYSGGSGECVQVALLPSRSVAIRDSKDATGSLLVVGRNEWKRFISKLKNGESDTI